MKSKPYQVGITGGIGAGKSVVAKIFSTLRVPVYDADSRAKMLMNTNPVLIQQIQDLLGQDAYINGQLNRSFIAKKVFKSKPLLNQLNSLIHPAVGIDYSEWVNKNLEAPIVLKEAALLFETKTFQRLDKVIIVSAPERLRIDRVLQRDSHRTESDVRAIMANQMKDEDLRAKADFIIENDESRPLIEQTLKIHSQLLVESGR